MRGDIFIAKSTKDQSCIADTLNIWKKEVPKQDLENEAEVMEGIKMFSKVVVNGSPVLIMVGILLGQSLLSMWGFINVSQILMIIPLISVNLPSNSQNVF